MRDFSRLNIALLVFVGPAVAACDAGPPVPVRPTSYLSQHWDATVPQQHDFTCGAASLATIITFYWSQPTSEVAVLATLSGRYTKHEIRRISEAGLSFDDIIYMANQLGYSAVGAKVAPAELANIAGPVIVHLDKGALKHFVVLRKVGQGVYYVSDPVVGQMAMQSYEFEAQYTGKALAIWKSSAKLPLNTKLRSPRDGIRVDDGFWRQIDVPNWPFHPHF